MLIKFSHFKIIESFINKFEFSMGENMLDQWENYVCISQVSHYFRDAFEFSMYYHKNC